MYLSGSIIVNLGISQILDLTSYLSPANRIKGTAVIMANVYMYLFISISFVILIGYLLNKNIFKISKKCFIISQILFVLSFPIVVIFMPWFASIF